MLKCRCICGKRFKNKVTMNGHLSFSSFVCKSGKLKPSKRHKLDLKNCENCEEHTECNLFKNMLLRYTD